MQKPTLIVALLAGIAATPLQAQEYPSREIKLICGFVAGSGADVMYRFMAEKLQQIAGKPVVVENRPGAQGHIATAFVAKSKPDGYTILPAGGSSLASIGYLMKTPLADPLKDFDYIGTVLKQGWYMTVDTKSPIKTVAEMTAHLKQKGSKGSYATSTNFGTVFAELYKAATGLETVQVNYKTIADSANDLASGTIDMAMADPIYTISNLRNGRIRALAVSTGQRVAATPDIPTMTELGIPGVDVGVWWSVQVAAGTPKPIRDTIGKWFTQMLSMDETKKFFANIGTDVFISSPEATRDLIVKDMESWKNYVARAKIEPQ